MIIKTLNIYFLQIYNPYTLNFHVLLIVNKMINIIKEYNSLIVKYSNVKLIFLLFLRAYFFLLLKFFHYLIILIKVKSK